MFGNQNFGQNSFSRNMFSNKVWMAPGNTIILDTEVTIDGRLFSRDEIVYPWNWEIGLYVRSQVPVTITVPKNFKLVPKTGPDSRIDIVFGMFPMVLIVHEIVEADDILPDFDKYVGKDFADKMSGFMKNCQKPDPVDQKPSNYKILPGTIVFSRDPLTWETHESPETRSIVVLKLIQSGDNKQLKSMSLKSTTMCPNCNLRRLPEHDKNGKDSANNPYKFYAYVSIEK